MGLEKSGLFRTGFCIQAKNIGRKEDNLENNNNIINQ
jgi:hypothetical protein